MRLLASETRNKSLLERGFSDPYSTHKKIDNYAIETAIASQTLRTVLRSVPRKGKLNTNSQLKTQLDVHLAMFIYLQDSDSPTGATNETI